MEYTVRSGFETLKLSSKIQEDVQLVVDERINASLLVTYSGRKELQVKILAKPGSSLVVMLKNEGSEEVSLQVRGSVYKDAALTLALCELNAGDTRAEVALELLEEGASAMLRSACIAKSRKEFQMQCTHHCPHTGGFMENYAVVEDGAHYRMEATGKIIRGAYESNSHQKTRVLTMSEQHDSEVVPVLLIDENDVKASHATTLGQPDENQLYYLQTRGLSRKQALGLLTVGYIMPITELFEQEAIRNALKDEIEMKVGLHA
ncbi:SufD family Fe-S cluster assembly protein [[Clostridium] innocuum]|nr:SufD family Fe-S cluster assembly protein [[Clostridium] innocuum]